MFQVKQYKDQEYVIYELVDDANNSWIKVAPERGGIITSFGVNGQELFYMDEQTFHDPNANVRGGNPILFPICGQLKDGKYELDGQTYEMKNHGLARLFPWDVVSTSVENEASITIRLQSNNETRQSFPYDFELLFRYTLLGNRLNIHQEYRNLSEQPMPMYAGFHPYFAATQKHIRYDTDAGTYLDYNDVGIKGYEGSIDLDQLVESVVFLDAANKRISFDLPELKRNISLEYGEPFKYVVLWSVKHKPFVCVEPWMALGGSLNTGKDVQMIQPGQPLITTTSFSCELT